MIKAPIVPRLLKMRFHRYCLSYFPRNPFLSDKPLSIVIPLAVKDIYRAGICVQSIRQYVRHPISEIIIAGQDHDDIRAFCAAYDLIYVNENDILPFSALASQNPDKSKSKPSNWVRQQLIKLSVFNFTNSDNVLIQDSDTWFMRDVTFFKAERQILYLSDEYTQNYERLLFDFLGPITRYHRSFVTHSMLMQRSFFVQLDAKVQENCGVPLVQAILQNIEVANTGGLSEFEIYGNFMNAFHKDAFETRYWYNKKVHPETRVPLQQLKTRFWNMNTISAHEH